MNKEKIKQVISSIFGVNEPYNTNSKGYIPVHCIFHTDKEPSAFLNPNDGFFECFAECGIAYQYKDWIKKTPKGKLLDNAFSKKIRIIPNQEVENLHRNFLNDGSIAFPLKQLGILNSEVINSLKLVKHPNPSKNNKQEEFWYDMTIPITVDGITFGYAYHSTNPVADHKTKAPYIPNGTVVPYDIWVKDRRPTIICEGMKDMLIARSKGFNAIAYTGGAGTLPKAFIEELKTRDKLVICFDNDKAGKEGSVKLAEYLYNENCRGIKILTNIFEVIKEDKEDLADFFIKYNKSSQDLQNYIDKEKELRAEDILKIRKKYFDFIHLYDCENVKYINKELNSTIQTTARFTKSLLIPKSLKLKWIYKDIKNPETKREPLTLKVPLDKDTMEYNILIVNSTSKKDRNEVIAKIAEKETLKNYHSYEELFTEKGKWDLKYEEDKDYQSISKYYIRALTNIIEYEDGTPDRKTDHKDYVAYVLNTTLENSTVYDITYKVHKNAMYKNEAELGVVDINKSSADISNFQVEEPTKISLDKFNRTLNNKTLSLQSISECVEYLFRYSKSKFSTPYLQKHLYIAAELTFNSCLDFKIGNKEERGNVYTSVIGDSRNGKSEIIENLINKRYKLGVIINTSTTTTTALIGGTDKSRGDVVKTGVLPNNTRGFVALEELQSSLNGGDIMKSLRDIKTSRKVKITRVAGDIDAECKVRMVDISNPRNGAKLNSFSNGPSLISKYFETAELARYDLFMLIPTVAYNNTREVIQEDNIYKDITEADFQERIKWAWSRKASNIKFDNGVESYLEEETKRLIKTYNTDSFPAFNNETFKKVARLSISLAIILGSVEVDFNVKNYENVMVYKPHVEYIINYLESTYKASPMNLEEYVKNDRRDKVSTPEDQQTLHNFCKEFGQVGYNLLNRLFEKEEPDMMRNFFTGISNGENLINKLIGYNFVNATGNNVMKTTRFNIAFRDFKNANEGVDWDTIRAEHNTPAINKFTVKGGTNG